MILYYNMCAYTILYVVRTGVCVVVVSAWVWWEVTNTHTVR